MYICYYYLRHYLSLQKAQLKVENSGQKNIKKEEKLAGESLKIITELGEMKEDKLLTYEEDSHKEVKAAYLIDR